MKFLKNLYWYPYRGPFNNCNSYLFDDEIMTLVDPGHEWNLRNLLKSIEEDGFEPRDISLIILTHGHPDHCEAAQVLRRMAKAKIALHELEDAYIRKDLGKLCSMFGMSLPKLETDLHLGEEINLGSCNLQIIHTPGHSPGSICIYWQQEKVLISGDLIFAGSVGRTDLPGGDFYSLKSSIAKVASMDIEYILPGHGEAIIGRKEVINNFKLIEAWL